MNKNMDKHKSEKGFTLIEMAVVIIIIGLLFAAYIPAYDLYRTQIKITDTQNNVARVSETMGQFRRMYGRYPRPAPLDATISDAGYGREYQFTMSNADALADFAANAASGTCTSNAGNKICRLVTPDNTRTGPSIDGSGSVEPYSVMAGAIPFKELGLDEEQSLDGYGNRLMYVVTAHLTDEDTYNDLEGGIAIVDENGRSLIAEEGTKVDPDTAIGHYLVLSYGENGFGAYTRDGVRRDCNPAGTSTANIFECVSGVNAGNAEFQYSDWDLAGEEFDDFMMYSSKADASVWKVSETNAADQHLIDLDSALFASSDIEGGDNGVEEGDLVLKNNGNLRTNSNVKAADYCNEDSTVCFQPSLMAGNPDDNSGGQQCPDGQYIIGISGTDTGGVFRPQIRCGVINASCPSGQFVAGVDSDGQLICQGPPPAGCEATTRAICGQDVAIPRGNNNDYYTITGGDARTQTYRCRNEQWSLSSSGGYCNCEDQLNSSTTTNLCTGAQYSGNVTRTVTQSCDANGQVVTETTYSGGTSQRDCDCTPITQQRNISCQDGAFGTRYGSAYTGRKYGERVYNCNSHRWGGYQLTNDTCTCTPRTENMPDQACPNGLTGRVTVTRTTNCPEGSYTYQYDESACRCQERQGSREEMCDQATHTGSIIRSEDYVCTNGPNQPGTWVVTIDDSVGCSPKSFRWNKNGNIIQTLSNPSGVKDGSSCNFTDRGNNERCWVRNFSGDYDIYNCQCQSN